MNTRIAKPLNPVNDAYSFCTQQAKYVMERAGVLGWGTIDCNNSAIYYSGTEK